MSVMQHAISTIPSMQNLTTSGCVQEEHLPNTLRQVGISLPAILNPTCFCPRVSEQLILPSVMHRNSCLMMVVPDNLVEDMLCMLQVLIYQALGFKEPAFGHVSLILAPDKSKLSKRHGATSVGEFREQGFLPEAMINYLSLLGWNDGTEQACTDIFLYVPQHCRAALRACSASTSPWLVVPS